MLLNSHTYYSYKFGTLSIPGLLTASKDAGYDFVCLTDVNSTSAGLDFIRDAKRHGMKPILGIDFRNSADQKYIGIAKNNAGYRELNEHLSAHLHAKKPFDDVCKPFSDAYVIYPYNPATYGALRENEYQGVRPSELKKLLFSKTRNTDRLVALQPVTFLDKRGFNTHRLLRAIDKNTLLSKLSKSEEAAPDEYLMTRDQLQEIYGDYPQIIYNTERIIEECSIDFEEGVSRNKVSYTDSVYNDFELIKQECVNGLIYRYGATPSKEVVERMNRELKVIKQMGYCSYFLINWDMVRYARSMNSYYVGRGSGANSIVAYLLRITDVDPIELDLYFERFINPSRSSGPDFDIDFSSRERNMITKYLFDTHGWDKTALVGTYNTFQYRSMIRELGKVFGLPANEISRLQHSQQAYQTDDIGKLVLKYSHHINGFPSHLSVHSSGIVIAKSPITTYAATMMPPKGFPTAHFSMIEAEDMGLTKFDVLGQRGLGKIKDAVSIVAKNKKVAIDIHDIKRFKSDEKVKDLLRVGETVGCFYVESPAMRMLLKKLQADDYIRLVAASSIIRPGVAKSGMMREYILRYQDPKRRELARKEAPALYEILEETFGVMVYQEDVIKVGHYFAGLSLAEADVLRKGMSWKFKRKNEFESIKAKFFDNCAKKKHELGLVTRIWEQIESFANYAFAKGHSASYAVESYQALYLKAHYPLEYLVATINNGGGFYRKEAYMHNAKMYGGVIASPCVNKSDYLTTIMGNVIYLGHGCVHDLEKSIVLAFVEERAHNGAYSSVEDFVDRVAVSITQLRTMIRAGAFRFTGIGKKELLWKAHFLLSENKRSAPLPTLFKQKVQSFTLPELWYHELEDAYDDIELIGFPLSASPFALVEDLPDNDLLAADLLSNEGKVVSILGYLVHVKGTRTAGGKGMSFGVFVDQEGHWIDTVQFPQIAARYPFRGPGTYLIKGKVVNEFGFVSIETQYLERLPTVSLEGGSTKLKAS